MKIKFPSGVIGYEIRHYMGMEDAKGHLLERPAIVQNMYNSGKCIGGKIADYSKDEIIQLCKEVGYALDIKADHIDNSKCSRWTSLNHYHMEMFYKKLQSLLNS